MFLRNKYYYKPANISLPEANDMLVTFAFTRHPFRRLASSYYNKIKYYAMLHNYENYARIRELCNKIMGKYPGLNKKRNNDYPSPKAFATYLLDTAKQYGPLSFNVHWRLQYALCPFCSLNFDYIGDIEDMNNHVDYLAELLGFKVIFEISNLFTSNYPT